MRDRIRAALKSSKADYTEIRIQEREATTVAYRGKDLETALTVRNIPDNGYLDFRRENTAERQAFVTVQLEL